MDAAAFRELQAENEQLRQQVAQLQKTVRDLQERLEAAERSAKRQAAPFSRGEPKKRPKKPGRKKGDQHGDHGHRPPPNQVDEVHDAPVQEHCSCGGDIVETHVDEQFQTEIPRTPIYRKFIIHCGSCRKCGKQFRGRHPFQTSDATGAAQSQLGADAQAAIVDLNKRAGMSYGKIACTFDRLFGMQVTRGACAQVVLRAGRRLQPVYEQIKQHIKTATHLTPDETGWRIGGHSAWLHAWVSGDGTTCYAVDPRRGGEVLAKVIGWDWSGTMTHDGCPAYDRFMAATHQQCVDHALRRAQALAEKQTGAAKVFPRQVIDLLVRALQTRDRFCAGQIDQATVERVQAEYVTELFDLTATPRANALNDTFAAHLYHHGERWFEFLLDPTVPATNHRAEQALKTPIVNRKVWGGNRTKAGATAQEVTSSVLETCKKKTIDAFTFVSDAFRGVLGNLWASPAA